MKFFYKGIGAKIFWSFSVLLSILILLSSILAMRYALKMTEDNAANQLRVWSVVLSQRVQNYLKNTETELKKHATSHEKIDDLLQREHNEDTINALHDYLLLTLAHINALESLSVVNRSGTLLASTHPALFKKTLKKDPLFTKGMKEFYYSDIYEDQDSGEKIALWSIPIGQAHYPSGVLIAQLKFSALYAMMDELLDQKVGVPGVVEAFLLDTHLRFLTPSRTAPHELIDSHLIQTPLMKHLNEEFWVGTYQNYENEPIFGTATRIKPYDWFLVLEQDYSTIEQSLLRMKRFVITVSVAIMLAVIIITSFLTLSITKPLQILVNGARKIAEGELRHPIIVMNGADEILFLAQEFEKMRVKLAIYQQQLIDRLNVSEQRLVESERLAAIGTLAASLAHEIRNPLNAMSLLLSQLQLDYAEQPSAQQLLQGIHLEIARLDKLVSEILNFAKPLLLQPSLVNMNELLKELICFFEPLLTEKHILLNTQLHITPLIIEGDKDKLRQALMNIIKNAIESFAQLKTTSEHTQKKPLLITLQLTQADEMVIITVEDNGQGISTQHKNQIFDLFFTTKSQGTGLGLSTVRKIIDAHGGNILIDSQINTGTKVSIYLHRYIKVFSKLPV